MANERLVEILQKGPEAWNKYRKENAIDSPNLSGADLSWADLQDADLSESHLNQSDLRDANLRGANLSGASLGGADVRGADLSRADLTLANLRRVDLSEANLHGAKCGETLFVDAKLVKTIGLDSCVHRGPSTIDHRTLANNANLPIEFLRGCGLPDFIIDNRHVLHGDSIQFYSCFISYSSVDEDFAKRVYNDLQGKGIRCWFAPEDLKTGDRFRDRINEAIRVHDRLLLILSKNSIHSDWVETEVEKAFAEERSRSKNAAGNDRPTVLFPIRLDGEILNSDRAWAETIRLTRHIGDFTQWKDHDAYQKAFQRLLRDLRASEAVP